MKIYEINALFYQVLQVFFLFLFIACPGAPACSGRGSCSDRISGNGSCNCEVRLTQLSLMSSLSLVVCSIKKGRERLVVVVLNWVLDQELHITFDYILCTKGINCGVSINPRHVKYI